MSWSATAYVKNLRLRPDGKMLTKAQKLVLFVIADYHNEDRGDAWASLGHLAYHSMHTRSGLIRVLRTLESYGLIEVCRDPKATQTRVTNRYKFPSLDQVSYPHTSDHRSPGLVTTGHHIFPKNLSNKSFQIQEKSVASEKPVDNCKELGDSEERFQTFTDTYPHRGGKRLQQAAAKALFIKLSSEDQDQAIKSARHYAAGLTAQGLHAKDQRRFLLDESGYEPWRDWVEPARITPQERAPPMPPKTDPIARGHWRRVYG